MEQKVIITKRESDVNEYLNKGWQVVSVTAQFVAISNPTQGSRSAMQEIVSGYFCFVIQKPV